MQWMIADRASLRIINWIRQQVIKINEHRSDQDYCDRPPALPVKDKGSKKG
jgi:hypothetical protein